VIDPATLLTIARAALHGGPSPAVTQAELRPLWLTLRAPDGRTKAALGELSPTAPVEALAFALGQALLSDDPRAQPGLASDDDELELAVGGPLRPIRAPAELHDDDAVIVRRAPYAGVLLPREARRAGFGPEQRLVYACRLAGLAGDAWEEPGCERLATPVQVASARVDGNAAPAPTVEGSEGA